MSINVTVKGNPVSIKRGKMVTATANQAEFDKRRKLRLQQVRQQSNHIAADIREKLKREKDKKLSEIEKEGQEKLKSWENRKLLDLQEQYEEALDEFGLAHQAAESELAEEQAKQVQVNVNRNMARSRGGAAYNQLQLEKNRKNYEKAMPQQRKKMSRDIENSRSAAVANIRTNVRKSQSTSPFKRKKGRTPASDSDDENRVPELGYGSDSSLESNVESPKRTSLMSKKSDKVLPKKDQETSCSNLNEYVNQPPQSPPRKERAIQTTDRPEFQHSMFPYDTRISERIRRRTALNKFCECDANSLAGQYSDEAQLPPRQKIEEEVQTRDLLLCNCCGCPKKPGSLECERPCYGGASSGNGAGGSLVDTGQPDRDARPDSPKQDRPTSRSPSKALRRGGPTSGVGGQENGKKTPSTRNGTGLSRTSRTPFKNPRVSDASRGSPKKAARMDGDEIPSKPKVTLRSAKTRSTRTEPAGDRVQQYDHRNRFTSLVSSTSRVEKVPDDDLMTPSSGDSEADYREQLKQRDLEAHLRGQKAIEKEKIHRDYKEMLKKLPVLQKQERIAEINMDKPQYHMGRDRLEQYERQKQNRLDNAYEKLFVHGRPPPPCAPPPPLVTLPRTNVRESPPSLNLADYADIPADGDADYDARLHAMLSNLQRQKMQLLREYGGDLGDYDQTTYDQTTCTTAEQKRKRGRTSPDYTTVDSSTEQTRTAEGRQSKKKRRKVKVKTRILQNTSTQTTPKPAATPDKVSEDERPKSKPSSSEGGKRSRSRSPPREATTAAKTADQCCGKTHVPCACCGADRDVEILIKLTDGVPEVEVCPASARSPTKEWTDEIEAPEKKVQVPETKSKTKETKEKEKTTVKKPSKGKELKVKDMSWHVDMTKNSSTASSSTSYMSLVEKSTMDRSSGIDKSGSSNDRSCVSCTGTQPGENMDPRLLTYIKKLLFMPHGEVENLSVSTVSSVSTPSQSLVDIPSNRPRPVSPQKVQPSPCADDSVARLRSVMKYFNLSPEALQRHIDAAVAASSFNSTGCSQRSGVHYNTPSQSEATASRTVSSSGASTRYGCSSQNTSSATVKSERTRMVEYTQIADHCTRKINDLTAKIEKVRAEKKNILKTTPTPADIVEPRTVPTPTESLDDVDKNVLEIDMSLAEKLKKMSPKEIKEKQAKLNERRLSAEIEHREEDTPSSDDRLMERMRRLLEPPRESEVAMGQPAETNKTPPKSTTETSPPPLMLDIPKLAPLSVPSLSDEPATNKKRKPPPTAAGLNGVAPHELSTIMEADSQPGDLSPKKATPKTPRPCEPCSTSSTTEKSELDAMEQMLHNIGMEWAIPTLRKTREAMAQSSSSSSDNSKSKSSCCDISLKDFLIKHATPTDFMTDSREDAKARQASTPVGDSGRGVIFLEESDISSVQNKSGTGTNSNKEKLTSLVADATDPLDKNVNPAVEEEEPGLQRSSTKKESPRQTTEAFNVGMLDTSSARTREVAELLDKFRQIKEADEEKVETSSKKSSDSSSKIPIPSPGSSPRKSSKSGGGSNNSSKDESKDTSKEAKVKKGCGPRFRRDPKDKDEPDSQKRLNKSDESKTDSSKDDSKNKSKDSKDKSHRSQWRRNP